MIRIACPACKASYTLDDGFLGKSVACQRCSHRFSIGDETLLPTQAAAPSFVLEAPEPHGIPAEEPAPERLPRRGPSAARRRGRNESKSILGPALVMGFTVLLVGAVVVGSIIFLVKAMNEEVRPTYARSTQPAPSNPFAIQMPAVNPADRASFVINSIDSGALGLTVLRQQSPRFPVGETPPANAAGADAVAKVKKSAAFVRVERDDVGGTGSGFFALEPGLFVTNAHVVGMMRPSDSRPKLIEVVLNSGEADEVRIKDVTVLAVDRKNDLALLRVKHPKVPPPLQIVSSYGLTELQEVYVAGFPLASQVGTNMSVAKSSVSALRKEGGTLSRVQTQGGMLPGNSGGPVVDALGRVVGVSVAVVGDTQLNFAVPTDCINDLYRGAARTLLLYPAAQAEGGAQVPVLAKFDDGLGRIGKVRLDWWIGAPGETRPPSAEAPAAKQGDSPRQSSELKYDRNAFQGYARGDVKLPPLPEGKAYWLQLVAVDSKDQAERYFTAAAYQPKDFVERKTVVGGTGVAASPGQTELLYRTNLRVRSDHGEFGFSPLKLYLKNSWEDGQADSGRKIKDFKVGLRANDEPFPLGTLLQIAINYGRSNVGGPTAEKADTGSLNELDKFLYGYLASSVQVLPKDLEVALPEGRLEPLKSTWTRATKLAIPFGLGKADVPKVELKCTYLGVIRSQGREQAVVRLESAIRQAEDSGAFGSLWGIARVDLQSRRVVDLYSFLDLEVEDVSLSSGIQVRGAAPGEESSLIGSLEFRWQVKPETAGQMVD